MNKKEIFQRCIDNLHGFKPIRSVTIREDFKTLREKEIDARIEIEFKNGHRRFGVEVKSLLKRPLPAYLYQLSRSNDEPLLVTSAYINPSIAADLRSAGIQYIDVAGNAFLQIGDCIHIEVKGKKPEYSVQEVSGSLFQPKLMQLLAIFIIDPAAVNQTVRTLAERAGLSKDRVSVALRLLKEKGWLMQSGKSEYRLTGKRELFDQWLMNYGERLRPKILLGNYKASPTVLKELPDLVRNYLQAERYYAIGGELGADLLTNYYRARVTDLFIHPGEMVKISQYLNLLPARDYNFRFFSLFSDDIVSDKEKKGYRIVHPLLIYAELLYMGGERERETSKMIFDQYLQELFE